jgi:Transglutaminase elicitor
MDRSLGRTGISWWLPGALALAACSAPPAPGPDALGDAKEAVRIGAYERPEALVEGASRRLADVITAEDVGQDFGVSEGRVPYADTYWPFVLGGTNAVWNPRGRDPRPPITKYMLVTNPYELMEAESWELQFHGPLEPGVTTWHGHCPGWSAAATTNAPILHPVLAGSDGRGGLIPCREGESGCVRFEIGDVNALMAEIYLDGPYSLIGATCNIPPYAVPRDMFGRVLARGCDGVNAGSLLVTAATLLKRHRVPFTIDLQKPTTTDQIWNQPTFAYHVYDFHPIPGSEAVSLVERGTAGGSAGRSVRYPWNPAARGFAFVDLGLRFVGEHGPNVTVFPGTKSTYELRMSAVIELDADPSDPRASIVGGEYLDLPENHANRLDVAPYLWVSRGPGPEVLPPYVGGDHHNPFVRPSLVRRLMALGQM